MKKLFFFIVVLTAAAQAQWKTLLEPQFKEKVNDICFVGATEAFAATDSAESCLYKTQDGGKTWLPVTLPTVFKAERVVFNGQNGWVFGVKNKTKSILSITSDGGKTWVDGTINVFANYTLQKNFSVSFPTATTGYAVVSAKFPPAYKTICYYVLKTEDGGKTWAKQDSAASTGGVMLPAVAFYDQNKGVFVGNKKVLMKYTEDGGKTWNASTIDNDRTFMSVRWLDANTAIASGDGFSTTKITTPVYKTTDGGKTWNATAVPGYAKGRYLYFKNSTEGVCAGIGEKGGVFVMNTTDGGNNWAIQNYQFPSSINALSGFGDDIYGLGSGSQIVKTSDLGKNWTSIVEDGFAIIQDIIPVDGEIHALNANGEFYSYDVRTQKMKLISSTGIFKAGRIDFADAKKGIMIKENRSILGTSDAGRTWTTVLDTIPYNTNNKAFSVSFPDNQKGYALFSNTAYKNIILMETTDGGATWNQIHSSTIANSPNDMQFFDALNGVITCDKMNVLVTRDGGKTWADAVLPSELSTLYASSAVNAVCIAGESTAYFAADGVLFKTNDKAATFTIVDVKPAEGADKNYYDVDMAGNKGVAVSYNGSIFLTNDGGSTWTTDLTFNGKDLLYTCSVDKEGIFVGSSEGRIYGLDVATAVEEKPAVVSDYKLYNSYPNPFNPSTVIRFSLPKTENVTMKIYNAIGKEVSTLLDAKTFAAGEHSVTFSAGNLPTGLYLCRIQAGTFTAVNKLLLIK
ncbi:MAG: YCF48-related protein [Bacteroidota bacterium]